MQSAGQASSHMHPLKQDLTASKAVLCSQLPMYSLDFSSANYRGGSCWLWISFSFRTKLTHFHYLYHAHLKSLHITTAPIRSRSSAVRSRLSNAGRLPFRLFWIRTLSTFLWLLSFYSFSPLLLLGDLFLLEPKPEDLPEITLKRLWKF